VGIEQTLEPPLLPLVPPLVLVELPAHADVQNVSSQVTKVRSVP
jgi:hypothetical protein